MQSQPFFTAREAVRGHYESQNIAKLALRGHAEVWLMAGVGHSGKRRGGGAVLGNKLFYRQINLRDIRRVSKNPARFLASIKAFHKSLKIASERDLCRDNERSVTRCRSKKLPNCFQKLPKSYPQ